MIHYAPRPGAKVKDALRGRSPARQTGTPAAVESDGNPHEYGLSAR
jgi:hypothetical protein